MKYLSISCFFAAFLSEFIAFCQLLYLKHCARKPQTAKNPLFRQMILRYSNCARLNIAIHNTGAYIKHYLHDYCSHPLRYLFFAKTGHFFFLAGLFTCCLSLLSSENLYFALLSILCSFLYFIFLKFLDCDGSEEDFVTIMTDYLDNTLLRRMEAQAVSVSQANEAKEATVRIQQSQPEPVSTKDDEKIIFSVINDFLV